MLETYENKIKKYLQSLNDYELKQNIIFKICNINCLNSQTEYDCFICATAKKILKSRIPYRKIIKRIINS